MRNIVLMFSCVTVCFCLIAGVPLDAFAQFAPATQPDLVVSSLACRADSKNLIFKVTNTGSALPAVWTAVAYVYVGTTKVATVNLKYPSSGNIATQGGSAYYFTNILITKATSVKVVVDPLNAVKESNESNNTKTATLSSCTYTPPSGPNVTLDYQIK